MKITIDLKPLITELASLTCQKCDLEPWHWKCHNCDIETEIKDEIKHYANKLELKLDM